MDLAGMLNDGDAPPKRPSQTSPPASSRGSAAQASPPAQNGTYIGGPGSYAPGRPGQQQTPSFGPPSASVGPPSHPQSRGLTPLHTPSQAGVGGGGQYPFPQQAPLQSPATAHPGQQQQYRGYEAYSATTPGARPPSHGYAQPSPSLGQYQSALNAAHNASLSPTPPSHPSQTPHSMRQSPLATMGHHPPPAPPHHYHQSQPNTPLGPPQLPQRHSNNQLDMSSPYHQRTYSGASNGMVSGSPAQHHPSIGNLVDSPSVYSRPSPQTRRTSDYRSSVDRERSVSVSPKTIVQPRPPSLGSRHSSQQEVYSTRGSLPPSAGGVAPSAETPSHVYPQTPIHVQPHHSYAASDVAQAYSHSSGSLPGPPVNGNSLSQSDNKTPLQHQSQKMGMSHLLAPTQHAQPPQPPTPNGAPTMAAKVNEPSPSQAQSQAQPHSQPPPPLSHSQQGLVKAEAKPEIKSETSALSTSSSSHPDTAATMTAAPEVQPPPIKQPTDDMSASAPAPSKAPLKRPAEDPAAADRAAKRGRLRKYRERPIWAHLSHQNPKAREPGVVPNSKGMSNLNSQPPPPPRGVQENGVAASQPNGTAIPAQANGDVAPWQRDPPLDDDLIHARRVLGRWEKSFRWNVPNPAFNRAVADWLYAQLKANDDIGTDPREGVIEIEAKIGTLIDEGTGRRCELPVQNCCVINPAAARRLRFESEMNEQEHRFMNEFLNTCIKESQSKGREDMKYKHIYETDSFRTLSKAGIAALPEAAHRRRPDRDLKLRTSHDTKTGELRARIVKVKLGEDLHIFGAGDPYDVRISMNLEINLDRPGFDPSLMTEEPTEQRRAPPNRKKNRLSYKHLAYQVDLTRVDREGLPHKYELELEVDAQVLREQIAAVDKQQQHAYTDVVDGFVSNMLMLMKQSRGNQ